MTTAIDSASLLAFYLKTNAALISEITVGGKVQLYGPPGLPPEWPLSKAVVYLRQHGTGSLDLPLTYETFQFRCYGTKAWEASAVFLKLKDALHRRAVTSVAMKAGAAGLLQFGRLVSGPDDMYEAEYSWPYVLGLFELHLGEMTLP